MRSLGTLRYDESSNSWEMKVEPHVAMMARRVFGSLPKVGSTFTLRNDDATCFELKWFLQRYPLDVTGGDLDGNAGKHVERITYLDQLIDPNYVPQDFQLAVPARQYQKVAAEAFIRAGALLLGDEVGIGKTATSIAAMTDLRVRPTLVVTLAHLPRQWMAEVNRFAPDLHCHILKVGKPYELPKKDGRGPDVIISSYHKLVGWCDVLAKYCKAVVFDEVQELRREESQKYEAALVITKSVQYRLGLSATPVYNYGGEFFNISEQLFPGKLGLKEEFEREWLSDKSLKDPDAFGSFLKDQHMMLRRTRKDVGRELPPFQKVTVPVESDPEAMQAIKGKAGELARMILSGEAGGRGDAMQAASEFDMMMRQATGVSKAPFVAEFVKMLLQQDIPVVLYGWHHAVYDVWMHELQDFNPQLYTGTQSANQKQASVDAFVSGESNLLIMSLRSGAGVDGLQKRCCTTVHGEFDWSPGVIEQNIGRVLRDGQAEPVVSYMMLSDTGSDPLMSEVIGLKTDQIEGIRGRRSGVLQRKDDGNTVKRMAQEYLDRIRK